MIPWETEKHEIIKGATRIRGDDPRCRFHAQLNLIVLPAYAGMILDALIRVNPSGSATRIRGDDPKEEDCGQAK